MMDFDKKARDILGSCTCHEAYRGRGLTAPDCVWCEHGADTAAALKAAYNEGLDDAAGAIDAESSRVLACQTKARSDFDESVNLNIRMTTCLLPALAESVRAKKVPT